MPSYVSNFNTACTCMHACVMNCAYISSARTCTEAGLDAGCCEGNCTVYRDDADVCYCDKDCSEQGDCCDDVDQQKQCPPSECTLTIGISAEQIVHVYKASYLNCCIPCCFNNNSSARKSTEQNTTNTSKTNTVTF